MKKRICIGIPTTGSIKAKTVFSLLWLVQKASEKYEFTFSIKEGCSVVQNRHLIVNDALAADCSHILFVDSDMLFGEVILEKLMDHGKEIVGVDANMRQIPLTSTVKHSYAERPNELFECDALGMGVMLVDMAVFKTINAPYFNFELSEAGLVKTGEDIYFCNKAKEAGFKIYCDPTVEIKHLGEYPY